LDKEYDHDRLFVGFRTSHPRGGFEASAESHRLEYLKEGIRKFREENSEIGKWKKVKERKNKEARQQRPEGEGKEKREKRRKKETK
jgi:hypothetical protein